MPRVAILLSKWEREREVGKKNPSIQWRFLLLYCVSRIIGDVLVLEVPASHSEPPFPAVKAMEVAVTSYLEVELLRTAEELHGKYI